MEELEKAADTVLNQCMNLKEDESFLVVFDKNKTNLAGVFLDCAKKITKNAKSIQMPEAKANGEEPPTTISLEMKKHAVLLLVTTKSLSHTDARREASKFGSRIASMPNITEDMAKRTLGADYNKIHSLGERILGELKDKKTLWITTESGTDLIISVRECFHDHGLYHNKGDFGNLPAGEVGFAPYNSNGILIIDKTMAGIGMLKGNIKFTIKDNYVVSIEGEEDAGKLRKLLEGFRDKSVYNIAEFAIGTNDRAQITGFTLEDEKVLGTVHLALGDNTSYPGGVIKAPTHLDGVISKPTLFVDGKMIMDSGKILI